jgi:hypothetical protein
MMIKNVSKYYRIFSIVVLAGLLSACALTPAADKPAATYPKATTAPSVIDIVGIHEWKPLQESTLNCALGSDDDGTLKYRWSSEQGTIRGEGKEVAWTAPETPGNYRVTVEVSNSKGEGVTFSKAFKVTNDPYNNETPDATIYLKLSLPSGTVVKGAAHPRVWSTSEIQCVVADKDTSELTYKWTAPTGKLAGNGLESGKANRVGWIAPGVAGDYTVSVVVTDKQGNSATGEVAFNVYCCRP